MTKAAIHTRSSRGDGDRQRDELLSKFGETHEIVAEYRDAASDNLGVGDGPGLKKLLEDVAQGKFDVLLCTDLIRLTRHISPEIIMAIRVAGVRVVTTEGGEIGFADLIAQAIMSQSAKAVVRKMSEWRNRTRRGHEKLRRRGRGPAPFSRR